MLALCFSSIYASATTVPTLSLEPGINAPPLRNYLRYSPVDDDFKPARDLPAVDESLLRAITEPTIEFGVPGKPLLVLLRVRNDGDHSGSWTLSTDRGSLRRIELFQLRGGVVVDELLKRDDLEEQIRQLEQYHAFAFDFSLEPGEERLLGVVFDAESSTQLPMSVMVPADYERKIRNYLTILVAASAGTLALILINALLFGLTGRKAFLHFVIAELAMLYQAVHLSGYTTIYLFPEHAEFARALSGVARVMFALFSIRFVRSFIRTRETWPALDRLAVFYESICWVAIFGLACYPFIPGLSLREVSSFSFFVVAVALISLPLIASIAVRRYGKIYLPLVFGWGIWGLYLVYTMLTLITPLPELPDQWRWMAPVGFIEAFALCISIGIDIRRVQKSEVEAQSLLADELSQRVALLEATAMASRQRDVAEQELNDAGRLLRATGHDSRNFVSALKIYSHMISAGTDLDKVRGHGKKITDIVDHLDHTLSLTMSSNSGSTLGHNLACIEQVHTKTILGTVKLIHEHRALEKNIEIKCHPTDLEFAGDGHALTRILSNFLGNAVKYSTGGRILLSARRRSNSVLFQVWDQGPGIAKESLKALLQPQHLSQRLIPETEGSGSGLNICLALCEQIGGTLTARSQLGSGSVFEVSVPTFETVDGIKANLAIVDEPFHWPATLTESPAFAGIYFTFHRSLEEAEKAEPDIVILDPSFYQPKGKVGGPYALIVSSFERTRDFRQNWAPCSHALLQKPVSSLGLATAIQVVGIEQMHKSEYDKNTVSN